jgi:ABC-type uncharacterized transport system ATPase component
VKSTFSAPDDLGQPTEGNAAHDDLSVGAGTVTALLGPNGAGKTTAVHIFSTLVRPDGGTAIVNGSDVVRDQGGVRAAIGLTGQFSAVDKLLTGEENLLLMARLRHLGAKRSKTRVAELLDGASRLLDESVRDDAGLALTVPSDGGVGALRTVLDRLDAADLEVDSLSIHTPDLDDVFFALTGKKDHSDPVDMKGTES